MNRVVVGEELKLLQTLEKLGMCSVYDTGYVYIDQEDGEFKIFVKVFSNVVEE
jgi:hypothetical protein